MKWILFASATVVLGGFVSGERVYRNAFIHTLVEIADLKDDSCRKSNVAVGTACPSGCLPKPLAGPEMGGRTPECRSVFWVRTCGTECDARDGFIRMNDGRFLESGAFIIRLEDPPEEFRNEFSTMGIELKSSASGIWRYRAQFDNPDDDLREVERMKRRLESVPYVISIERIIK